MRKFNLLLFALLAISMLFYVSSLVSAGEESSYTMTGKISAIEPDYNTVVIQVPLAKDEFTVAGPLSSDAILLKGDKSAKLDDFSKGESVTVHFYSTDEGHVINKLCDVVTKAC